MRKYENLFQIGEVASLLGISRKMILRYEDNGLIEPVIVDKKSGYRYFDSYTIARIQLILDLRKTDMSLANIRKYLNGEITVDEQIKRLTIQSEAIKNAITQLSFRETNNDCLSKISRTTIPSQYCIYKDFIANDIGAAVSAFVSAYDECLRQKFHLSESGMHFCEFRNDLFCEDFFETENIHMRICISVNHDSTSDDIIMYPETEAISISFCGSYEQSFIAYDAIKNYIKQHSLVVNGYPRELYLEGNFSNDYDNNIVQIVVPVK